MAPIPRSSCSVAEEGNRRRPRLGDQGEPSLRDLWSYTHRGWALRPWKRWYFWATSRLAPVIETARLIHRHLPNVMTYFAEPITNAVSEELNSKTQTIKKMAYGFRNREHFKTAIHFHCGGLDLYPATHGISG